MPAQRIKLSEIAARGGIVDGNGDECISRHADCVVYYRGEGFYSRTDSGNFVRRNVATFCRIKLGKLKR